eukprot:6972333-Alexandrium_andersonii.AAC.1
MSASLVGSEMCIRDSMFRHAACGLRRLAPVRLCRGGALAPVRLRSGCAPCLLYTSDAADDM